MSTLRLSASSRHREVQVTLFSDGTLVGSSTSPFAFGFLDGDAEEMRWYFEDYVRRQHEPVGKIARRIEKRIREIGFEIFEQVFRANDSALCLWSKVLADLHQTRIEIIADTQEVEIIPWELMRDTLDGQALSLSAHSFTRVCRTTSSDSHVGFSSRPLRVLIVISRPYGGDDVPYRSVATEVLRRVRTGAHIPVRIEILRPPGYEALRQTLRRAYRRSCAYDILHFDGHGTYLDVGIGLGVAAGARGYLLFENPGSPKQPHLIDGQSLGRLMRENGVPILVLNACRSGYAGMPDMNGRDSASTSSHISDMGAMVIVVKPGAQLSTRSTRSAAPGSQLPAWGSLAQEVVGTGVSGVVAMRYDTYVHTAADFMPGLYYALASGATLGEAVSAGRRYLSDHRGRPLVHQAIDFQDWAVPVVYESLNAGVPEANQNSGTANYSLTKATAAFTSSGYNDQAGPKFCGRHETILFLDRAFDHSRIILLHSEAGSGKTASAIEFARWYKETGGIYSQVLFTTFANGKSHTETLDLIVEDIDPQIKGIKQVSNALNCQDGLDAAMNRLRTVSTLWIWDGIEQIAAFPNGSSDNWQGASRRALVGFLREASNAGSRFLLTSRRGELDWLDDLPTRIAMPPMPQPELAELARSVAQSAGYAMDSLAEWRELLACSAGNPRALLLLVKRALADGAFEGPALKDFINGFRSGEISFDTMLEESHHVPGSRLLNQGLSELFNHKECRQLSALCLFRDFVNANAVAAMGDPETGYQLHESDEAYRDSIGALLKRVVEVGHLYPRDSEYFDYYAIAPNAPFTFKRLYEEYSVSEGSNTVPLAYANAIGALANYLINEYGDRNQWTLTVLTREKNNLLHARELARVHGDWLSVAKSLVGLEQLHRHTQLIAEDEWDELLEETVKDFVDPATDGPIEGREEGWIIATQCRIWSERKRSMAYG